MATAYSTMFQMVRVLWRTWAASRNQTKWRLRSPRRGRNTSLTTLHHYHPRGKRRDEDETILLDLNQSDTTHVKRITALLRSLWAFAYLPARRCPAVTYHFPQAFRLALVVLQEEEARARGWGGSAAAAAWLFPLPSPRPGWLESGPWLLGHSLNGICGRYTRWGMRVRCAWGFARASVATRLVV
ncbi:uncharacterized protein B0I36DRAFT_97780 [Microdochium trichocladiopsis]|uniref:Uncharacterized protein n=1 Tax=Microdochium trichocladiopsis TaxID=1682393 RepID=A0A9P9BRH7_9PEZI|nr:uncharacterized protein B0I36DRAFT_97780 [Microdochium trichocladiopsis]KAH7035908.1 hypothetical protein B0I36DRAFT_97780 [Microdochium trichocladiopsis]